jgi:hypothetical protein
MYIGFWWGNEKERDLWEELYIGKVKIKLSLCLTNYQ